MLIKRGHGHGAGRERGNTESNWIGGLSLLKNLKSQSLGSLGSAFTPQGSLAPHLGPALPPAPGPGGTLLLLGIIHADLKDGGPLATQKGHGGGCTSCAPFQAVDTATPVLSPKEVVAMVTQTKGMVKLRTLIHNLGMERRLLRSWRYTGALTKPPTGVLFPPLGWDPLRVIALQSEVPDPEPSRRLMATLSIPSFLGPINSFASLQHTHAHKHHTYTQSPEQRAIHVLIQQTSARIY